MSNIVKLIALLKIANIKTFSDGIINAFISEMKRYVGEYEHLFLQS